MSEVKIEDKIEQNESKNVEGSNETDDNAIEMATIKTENYAPVLPKIDSANVKNATSAIASVFFVHEIF